MRFESKRVLNGSIADIEKVLESADYLPFVVQHNGSVLEAQLLDLQKSAQQLVRKVRYLPKPVIESLGPKKVPPHYFAFVEHSTYDYGTKTLKFRNEAGTAAIAKHLDNTGSMRLKALSPTQTERFFEGDISLKLPLLMKPIAILGEALIQREGLKLLDSEVHTMNRFLAEVIQK